MWCWFDFVSPILETDCGAVKLDFIWFERCFWHFVNTIYINEGRLNIVTPATQDNFNSTTNSLQNDHEVDLTPPKPVSTKNWDITFTKVGIYCRAAVFYCSLHTDRVHCFWGYLDDPVVFVGRWDVSQMILIELISMDRYICC